MATDDCSRYTSIKRYDNARHHVGFSGGITIAVYLAESIYLVVGAVNNAVARSLFSALDNTAPDFFQLCSIGQRKFTDSPLVSVGFCRF